MQKSPTQKIYHLLLAALLILIGSGLDFSAEEPGPVTGDWQLTQQSEQTVIQLNGQQFAGNQLQTQWLAGACQAPRLSLAFTASSESIADYLGEKVALRLTLGQHTAVVTMPITEIAENHQGQLQAILGRFVINDQLHQDLSQSREMVVELLEPVALSKLLTRHQERFSTSGFASLAQLTQNLCLS